MKKLKITVLLLLFLILFLVNSILYGISEENIVKNQIKYNNCNYWKNNFDYSFDPKYPIQQWLIIKTIQNCKLKNHKEYLLKNLNSKKLIVGISSEIEKGYSPVIGSQAEIALNYIYYNKYFSNNDFSKEVK